MATYNQLPVYKATYDLLLYVYQTGKDVQRDYRYTLGDIDSYLPRQCQPAEGGNHCRGKGETGCREIATAPAARPETTVAEKLRQRFANDRIHIQTIVCMAKEL